MGCKCCLCSYKLGSRCESFANLKSDRSGTVAKILEGAGDADLDAIVNGIEQL